MEQFFRFKFDPNAELEGNIDIFNRITQDLVNCRENISNDQKVVGILNAIGKNYKNIKNILEYGRNELSIEIIHKPFRNRELELKTEQNKVLHIEN